MSGALWVTCGGRDDCRKRKQIRRLGDTPPRWEVQYREVRAWRKGRWVIVELPMPVCSRCASRGVERCRDLGGAHSRASGRDSASTVDGILRVMDDGKCHRCGDLVEALGYTPNAIRQGLRRLTKTKLIDRLQVGVYRRRGSEPLTEVGANEQK